HKNAKAETRVVEVESRCLPPWPSSLLKKAVWYPKACVFLGNFEGQSAPERLVQQAARCRARAFADGHVAPDYSRLGLLGRKGVEGIARSFAIRMRSSLAVVGGRSFAAWI